MSPLFGMSFWVAQLLTVLFALALCAAAAGILRVAEKEKTMEGGCGMGCFAMMLVFLAMHLLITALFVAPEQRLMMEPQEETIQKQQGP